MWRNQSGLKRVKHTGKLTTETSTANLKKNKQWRDNHKASRREKNECNAYTVINNYMQRVDLGWLETPSLSPPSPTGLGRRGGKNPVG